MNEIWIVRGEDRHGVDTVLAKADSEGEALKKAAWFQRTQPLTLQLWYEIEGAERVLGQSRVLRQK